MKKFAIIALFVYITSYSQQKGKIIYKSFFTEKQATEELKEQNRIWYQEELDHEMMAKLLRFTLDFNKNKSIFYMSENMISDIENEKRKKYVVGLFYGLDKFYFNNESNILIEQLQYSFGSILKKKDANFVKWNLTNETKKVQGYTCYKATYIYIQKWNGREFEWPVTAWYCPEIPVSLGPIRYSGLPGLILELHEKERGYVVEKIDFNTAIDNIDEPKEGEFLTDEEIKNRNNKIKEVMLNSN